MTRSAVAIELRAACDACARPLPINRLASRARCLWCGHDNPIEPETWDHLLHEPLAQAGWMNDGETGLVSQVHHKRSYVLSFAPAALPPKRAWRARGDFAEGLLAGLLATSGEADAAYVRPTATRDSRCTACGGAVPVDGRSRAVPCPFCGVSLLIPDDLWAKLHPDAAIQPWVLITEPAQSLEEPTWAGEAVAGPNGAIYYAATVSKGGGIIAEGPKGRPLWRRLDLSPKTPGNLRFCLAGELLWVRDRKVTLQLDPRTGATVRQLDIPELRDARELVSLPDGRVLAVGARSVRVAPDGAMTDAWAKPEELGFFARILREPEPTGPYPGDETRLAAGADGALWQVGERSPGVPFVARLDPEGRRLWSKDLEWTLTGTPPQPGPDGAWLFVWNDEGARVIAYDVRGARIDGPAWGRFRDGAWDGVPRMVRTPDGGIVYDLWGKVRRFGADGVRGNTNARDADREAAEAGEEEEEDGES